MLNHDNLGVPRRDAGDDPPLRVDQGTGYSLESAGARCSPVPVTVRAAPFGQAMTRSHHASHGTAADGIMQE